MSNALKKIIDLAYSFLEQLVFLLALICGLAAWSIYDNVVIAVFIFIAVCVLFWALPSILKRLRK